MKSGMFTYRVSIDLPNEPTELNLIPDGCCSKTYIDERVPNAIEWSVNDVVRWISELGFPEYKNCFIVNNIDGKQLIMIDASALPKMGITKWTDIKKITASIRNLLKLENPNHKRTMRLPPRDTLGMYLEEKSYTGTKLCCLSFPRFEVLTKDSLWEPPLENRGLIFNHIENKKSEL